MSDEQFRILVRSKACQNCYFITRKNVSVWQRLVAKAIEHNRILPCRSNHDLCCHNYFETRSHLVSDLKIAKYLKSYEYILPSESPTDNN